VKLEIAGESFKEVANRKGLHR